MRIRFVQDTEGQSTKQRELEISARRAHAARIAHQRRRGRWQAYQVLDRLQSWRPKAPQDRNDSGFVQTRQTLPREEVEETSSNSRTWDSLSVEDVSLSDVETADQDLAVAKSNYAPSQQKAFLDKWLDQSRTDPFSKSDLKYVPRAVLRALDFSCRVWWPVNVNSAPTDSSYTMITQRGAALHPHVFHSLIACAAMFLQRNAPNSKIEAASAACVKIHRMIAVRLINEEIDQLNGAIPSDDLVMAMCAIVRGAVAHSRIPPSSSISRSPLAKAQNLHFYTTQDIDPQYVKAFFKIIDMKGGLTGVETPALATLAEFFDLTISTLRGTSPRYDWRHPRQPLLSYEIGGLILEPMSAFLSKDLGLGFDRVIHRNLYEVLNTICELIIALDRYVRKVPSVPPLHLLVHSRNAIQHALCRITPLNKPMSLTEAFQETARAALLCFSDMAIFPTPTTTGVRSRLVSELYLSLCACEYFEASTQRSHQAFVLWATMIGAVASSNLFLHDSYTRMLKRLLSTSCMSSSWEVIRLKLLKFVWWDYVCNEPGLVAYYEATDGSSANHILVCF